MSELIVKKIRWAGLFVFYFCIFFLILLKEFINCFCKLHMILDEMGAIILELWLLSSLQVYLTMKIVLNMYMWLDKLGENGRK